MRNRASVPLLFAALLLALLTLATLPAAPARAASPPTTRAWDIKADFTGGTPAVLVTIYDLVGKPPVVANASTIDIWTYCVKVGPGTIQHTGGRAIFDGNAYLRCPLPPGIFSGCDCQFDGNPMFFFAAEGVFAPTGGGNPILAASDGSFIFSLPGNGTEQKTRVDFPTFRYETSPWQRDSGGNELVIGQDGPTMITVSNALGFLDFLDPSWQPFFQSVSDATVGHRMLSAGGAQTWTTPAARLPFHAAPSAVFIGYNPVSGAIFHGELASAEGDPPGCSGK